MKKTFYFAVIIITLIFSNCNAGNTDNKTKVTETNPAVIQLTNDTFKKLVFNYEVNKVWKYEGTKPAIVDFYADWCPPCRQLSPLIDEIAKEFSGKIVVYRVNTDTEKELAQNLGISSLPTLLYIPATGKPQFTLGYAPKDTLMSIINKVLLIK